MSFFLQLQFKIRIQGGRSLWANL